MDTMFSKYELKNGIRVVTAPLQETKAVTVLVLVKAGSRYETKDINGISHFVEHLMFKGTKKRPNTLSISKELDSIGAEYNAFTAKDHTGYYVKANHEKLALALDLLSDILFNSKFESREIAKERGVIVEEINMYEDNPIMYVEDLFEQTVFGDRPLGWNIAGPKHVIRTVSRKKLYEYYRSHYRPRNLLVVVAGRIDDAIKSTIEQYFDKSPRAPKPSTFKQFKQQQQKPQISVMEKNTEQVQLAIGFPAYSYFQKKLYSLYLLSVILGGNMSSRLFISIREQQSLCYFIRSSINVYEDTGTLMIQAGLDKQRIDDAITSILQELKAIKSKGVTRQELKKAKEYLKGKLVLDLESSDSVANWLGKQELLRGTMYTPAEQMAKVDVVSQADVQRVARDLIKNSKLNLALIGPFQDEARFRKIAKL